MGQSLCKVLACKISLNPLGNPSGYLCCWDEETEALPGGSHSYPAIPGKLPDLSGPPGRSSSQCSRRAVLLLPGDSSSHIIKTHQLLKPWRPPEWGLLSLSSGCQSTRPPGISDLGSWTLHESFPDAAASSSAGRLCGRWWGWPEAKLCSRQRFLGTISAPPGGGSNSSPLCSTDCMSGAARHPLSSLRPWSKPLR